MFGLGLLCAHTNSGAGFCRSVLESNGKPIWTNCHKLRMDTLSGIVWADDAQI